MKLTSAQVERTLTQFRGEAIPDDHPVIPQLNDLFGEHTFFLDSHGLNIVEPAEAAGSGAQSPGAARTRTNRRCRHTWIQTLIHYRLIACGATIRAATAMRASPSCRCDG